MFVEYGPQRLYKWKSRGFKYGAIGGHINNSKIIQITVIVRTQGGALF